MGCLAIDDFYRHARDNAFHKANTASIINEYRF